MIVFSILRTVAALVFLFFLPGYVWTWALYGRGKIGALERSVYAIALSIALLSTAYFFANLLIGIPVNLPASFVVVLVLTALPLAHLWLKKKGFYTGLKTVGRRGKPGGA